MDSHHPHTYRLDRSTRSFFNRRGQAAGRCRGARQSPASDRTRPDRSSDFISIPSMDTDRGHHRRRTGRANARYRVPSGEMVAQQQAARLAITVQFDSGQVEFTGLSVFLFGKIDRTRRIRSIYATNC